MSLSGTPETNLNAEIRLLPPVAKSQLANIMEVTNGWREVMGRIPDEPWIPGQPIPQDELYKRRYSSDDISLISEECRRSSRLGFEVLLEEWGTSGKRRPTLTDLMALLQQMHFYRAVDYIIVSLLKENAPVRMESNLFDEFLGEDGECNYHHFIQRSGSAQVKAEVTESGNATTFSNPVGMPTNFLNGNFVSDTPQFEYDYLSEITNKFCDLPLSMYGNKLGEGAFGCVYLGSLMTSSSEARQVAVKRLQRTEIRLDEQFRTEVEVLSRCKHENLLPLVGYSCDGPQLCLVYLYMQNGSLLDRLACEGGSVPIPYHVRINIADGSAAGIVHLHTVTQRPLVHRDIKSANILLSTQWVPKVGDFGLVHAGGRGNMTATAVKTTTVFGTSAYMAPEAFRGDISVKMDTFSFGIVLFELLTGLPPYDENREGCDLLSHILENDKEPWQLLDVSAGDWQFNDELFALAEKCTREKKLRPTMQEVLKMLRELRE